MPSFLTRLRSALSKERRAGFQHRWEIGLLADQAAAHLARTTPLPATLHSIVVSHALGEGGRLVLQLDRLAREIAARSPVLTPWKDGSGLLHDARAEGAAVQLVFAPSGRVAPGHAELEELRTPIRPPGAPVAGWVRHRGGVGPRLGPQITAQERREGVLGYWSGWGPLLAGTGPRAHLWSPAAATLTLQDATWMVESDQLAVVERDPALSVRAPGLWIDAEAFPRPLRLRHALALAGPDPGVRLVVAGRVPPPTGGADEIAPGVRLSEAGLQVQQGFGVRVNGKEAYLRHVPLAELRSLEIAPGRHPYGPVALAAWWDPDRGVLRFRPPYGVGWHLHPRDGDPPEWLLGLRHGSRRPGAERVLALPFGDPAVPPDARVVVRPLPGGALRLSAAGLPLRIERAGGWRIVPDDAWDEVEAGSEFVVGGTLFGIEFDSRLQSGE